MLSLEVIKSERRLITISILLHGRICYQKSILARYPHTQHSLTFDQLLLHKSDSVQASDFTVLQTVAFKIMRYAKAAKLGDCVLTEIEYESVFIGSLE